MVIILSIFIPLLSISLPTQGGKISINNLASLKDCAEGITSKPGDVCLVQPGKYELSALEGATLRVSVENLTIKSQQGPDVTIFQGSGLEIFQIMASGVVIDGFTLSNSGPNPLVKVKAGTIEEIEINNNIFTNEIGSYADGVQFFSLGYLRGVKIVNNVFRGGKGSAIRFQDISILQDVQIQDNIIRSMKGTGVLVEDVERVEGFNISGSAICEISEIGSDGVRFSGVQRLADVTLYNCSIKDGMNGVNIDVIDTINSLGIINSDLQGNRDRGIVIEGGSLLGIRITDNDLRDNGGDGISLTSSGKVEGLDLSRDIVAHSGGSGISLAASGDLISVNLSENHVRENTANGIIHTVGQDLSGLTVEKNEISKNGSIGLALQAQENLRTIRMTENMISKNGHHGLEIIGGREIEGVTLSRNEFTDNKGIGLHLQGHDLLQIDIELNMAGENDDHGIMIRTEKDLRQLCLQDNKAVKNDRDGDTIGTGLYLDVGEDLADATIKENTSDENFIGMEIGLKSSTGQASEILLSDNQVHKNQDLGIQVSSRGDLRDSLISGNVFSSNSINLALLSRYGSDVSVKRNEIEKAGQIGLLLDTSGVTVTENQIVGDEVGIAVRRAADNRISLNNITGNKQYGIDARDIILGQIVDAESNWWGEPSGPGGVGPGIGDAVTVNVDYDPWLREPAVSTGANFQITAFDVTPPAPDVGETVTITATAENTGTDEGTQDVVVRIKSGSTVLLEERRTTSLSPVGSMTIASSYTFSTAGTYTVEVATDNDTESKRVVVGGGLGPGGKAIEEAIASLIAGDPASAANPDLVIGDQEILKAVEYWITGGEVPSTGGKKIDDAKMLALIDLWVTGTAVSASAAGFTAESIGNGATLAVKKIGLFGNAFVVEGEGIAAIEVQVFDLTGRAVFSGQAAGNALAFNGLSNSGRILANGPYLYTVKAYGLNGEVAQSRVQKLALLR